MYCHSFSFYWTNASKRIVLHKFAGYLINTTSRVMQVEINDSPTKKLE